MIQAGSYLKVIDNSGAKIAFCIKIITGYKRRYAGIGALILVSIRGLRSKRRSFSKIKKGEVYQAVIARTKINKTSFSGDKVTFLENSVFLLNKKHKLVGTRIFGCLPKSFRYTKFMKMLSVSAGIIK
jgi:large subunit ribosomal protein L14